jgi:hypothetical protein
LGYNNNCIFFTVELKYTTTNKIKFSPHQIAFHVKHPLNTFIIVLDARDKLPKLYEGSCIRDLVAGGLKHKPKVSGFKEIGGLKHKPKVSGFKEIEKFLELVA